jgi:hypothetical protein
MVQESEGVMRRWMPLPWILLTSPWLATTAASQIGTGDWRYKAEISGDLGHGWFLNGRRTWGQGLYYGVGAAIRPFLGAAQGLAFELRAARLSDDARSAQSSALRSRIVAFTGLYHFRGRRRVQPYLLGGLAWVHAERDTSCDSCVFERDPVSGALTGSVSGTHSGK